MKCKLNEEFVYQAVLDGELEIWPDGTIWRVSRRRWSRWKNAVISQPCSRVRAEHPEGDYLAVTSTRDGISITARAHRLVYRHFKGPIPEGMTVNHEDGLKTNNEPSNLELATDSEQAIHAIHVLGTHPGSQPGELNPSAKLSNAEADQIRLRRSAGEMLESIAADFGVTGSTVSKIARGTTRAGVR